MNDNTLIIKINPPIITIKGCLSVLCTMIKNEV